MLYYLLTPLRDQFIGFNLFRYISFRAALSVTFAFLISLLLGRYIIKLLRQHQIGEEIREDGPKTHLSKSGTPSMGGIIIIISVIIPTILFAQVLEIYIWLVLLVTLFLSLIGFRDDYLKIVKKYPKGLIARYKLIFQILLGLFVGCMIYFFPVVEEARTVSTVPFFKNYEFNFGIFYIPFIALVITATSNSANLADGLDGLLAGLMAIAAISFGVIAYVSGRVDFSDYLNIIYLQGAGELTIFCAALFGACLGFLWYNCHPAQVFMGDTGSLALGGSIAAVAILVKKEFWLLLICGLLVIESLSVIIQVWYYKRTKKRVFKMAPLHHHYELKGLAESKVVVRFWIISIILSLLTLTTFKIR